MMKGPMKSAAAADAVAMQVKELYAALETLELKQRQWNSVLPYGALSPAAALKRYRETMESLARRLPQIVPNAISQLPADVPAAQNAGDLTLPDAILK